MDTYKHSGGFSPVGALITGIAGVTIAAVLGIIYTFAQCYIPFIYINFLLTLGMGAAIGFLVGCLGRWGKIRSAGLIYTLTFLACFVGVYVEWGTTPIALIGPEVGLQAYSPFTILGTALFLYENGSWGMSEDSMVTGLPLVAIWITEIVMIFGCAFMTAVSKWNTDAFCEPCDEWTKTEKGIQVFEATGRDHFCESLTTQNLGELANIPLADPDAKDEPILRLNLSTCNHCRASNFLTAEVVSFKVDKHGTRHENDTTDIFRWARINEEQVEFVRQLAARGYLQEALEQQGDAVEGPQDQELVGAY